jgi:hypothetical protein
MDGLAALVKEQLQADPFSGVIFYFRSKRADRVKLIFWDGTGLCLFAKKVGGRQVPLAAHRGRGDAAVGGAIGGVGVWIGCACGRGAAGTGRCAIACGEVNQAQVWFPTSEPTD